jgi:hypothetical protein
MALCFTLCGLQVCLDQGYQLLRTRVCGKPRAVQVFKPAIDASRETDVARAEAPPRMIQMQMAFFVVAVALICSQWYARRRTLRCAVRCAAPCAACHALPRPSLTPYSPSSVRGAPCVFTRTCRVHTLVPCLLGLPPAPDALARLVACWMLMALPLMLGWPWVKIHLNERATAAAARRAVAKSARGTAEAGSEHGGMQLL